ncbi:MAG: hypothetical protein Kow00108_05620 [Calditrichia bacterium]
MKMFEFKYSRLKGEILWFSLLNLLVAASLLLFVLVLSLNDKYYFGIFLSFSGMVGIFGLYSFKPVKLIIDFGNREITIKRIIGAKKFSFKTIKEVIRISSEIKCCRINGIGYFFCNYGKYECDKYGEVLLYSTYAKKNLLIKTDSKQIVVSPESPEQVASFLNKCIN